MPSQATVVKEVQTRFTANISDYRAKMRQLADTIANTRRTTASAMKSTSSGARKLGRELEDTSRSSLPSIRNRLDDVGTSARISSRRVDGLGSSLKKIGLMIGAVLSVREIASFGKSCIELGSDLAEVQNVVEVTFSSMSSQVDQFAKNAAKQFGLSETMAKRYTGTFGAMSKAFGFSEQQAYSMSTALTGLAGDVASFYNITQDEAYTKLKSVFTGETESLKDLGVVMTQTALDQFALSNGFGKTTKAMTEQEKVALRYAFVQKQLATASGDFARTSDGWANQVRILNLQIESLKANIGQGMINILTPVIKTVNELIGRLVVLTDRFRAFTEMLTGKKSSGGSGLGTAASAAADVLQNTEGAANASNALTNNTKQAGEAAKKAAEEFRGLMGFDQINKLADKDSLIDTESVDDLVDGTEAVAQGLNDSASGASELTSQLDDVAKKLANIWDVFQKAWANKGEAVIRAARGAFTALKTAAADVGKSFYDVFTDGTGQRWAESLLNLFRSQLGIIESIAKAFDQAWKKGENGKKLVKSFFDMFSDINDLVASINDSFSKAFSSGVGVSMWEHVLRIVTNVNDTIGAIARNFRKAWEHNDNGVRIWSAILGAADDVLAAIDRMSKATRDWAKKLNFEPIVTAFTELFEAVEPLVDTIANGLADAYEDVLLPLGKWFIEKGAPKSIKILTGAVKGLNDAIKAIGAKNLIVDASIIFGMSKGLGVVNKVLSALGLSTVPTAAPDMILYATLAIGVKLATEGFSGLAAMLFGTDEEKEAARKRAENSGIWWTLGSGLAGALNDAGDKINAWFEKRKQDLKDYAKWWKKLGKDLGDFTVNVKNTSSQWWKNVKKWWKAKAGNAGEFWTNVKDQSKTWWSNVKRWWDDKVGAVSDFTTGVKNHASTWWTNVKTWWKGKVDNAGDFWTGVKDQSRTWWSNTKSWWREKADNAGDFAVSVKNSAVTWWNNVKNWWSNAAGELWTSLNIRLPRVNWHWDNSWGISIPVFDGISWNAKGGILDGAQLFGAKGNTLLGGGEAGREALLPLDRNTEWMDQIADRVTERMYEAPEPAYSIGPAPSGDLSDLTELLSLLRDLKADVAAMRRDGMQVGVTVENRLDGRQIARNSVQHINRQAQATSVNPLSKYF